MHSTHLGHTPVSPRPSVLFVCTGNVCRSPFAEYLLRSRTPGTPVASRGIFGLEGRDMESQMAGELAARGIRTEGFRARQVSAADLDADLVLTMSRRQRIHLLEEFPGAARRIGHIGHVPELVRDVGANPSVPLRQLISSWTRRPNDPKRDIPDPFGKDAVAAANTAALLTTLVEQLAPILKSGGAQP